MYLDGISLIEKSICSVFAHFYLSFSVSMCVRQLSSQTFHNHKYLDSGYYVKGMHNIASVYCTLVKSNIFKIHLFHTKCCSSLLTYFLTDISRPTDIYIYKKTTLFGVLLVHNAHFLLMSLLTI